MKRLINDENPIELNIIIFTFLYMLLFILIVTPIIIAILSIYSNTNPELMSILFSKPVGIDATREKINVIETVLQFLSFGIISEFIRRKKSEKFKLTDTKSKRFWIYMSIVLIGQIIIKIINFQGWF